MSVRLLLAAVVLACVVAVGGTAAAAPRDDGPCPTADFALSDGCTSTPRFSCGSLADVDAPQAIRTRGLGCAIARRVAKAHWLQSGRFDRCAARRSSCRVRGYRCVRRAGGEVRCRDGVRQVRFRYES